MCTRKLLHPKSSVIEQFPPQTGATCVDMMAFLSSFRSPTMPVLKVAHPGDAAWTARAASYQRATGTENPGELPQRKRHPWKTLYHMHKHDNVSRGIIKRKGFVEVTHVDLIIAAFN